MYPCGVTPSPLKNELLDNWITTDTKFKVDVTLHFSMAVSLILLIIMKDNLSQGKNWTSRQFCVVSTTEWDANVLFKELCPLSSSLPKNPLHNVSKSKCLFLTDSQS